MKKIYIFLALAIWALPLACVREMAPDTQEEEISSASSGIVTLRATMEQGLTKTSLDPTFAVVWNANDQIRVYNAANPYGKVFTLNDESAGSAQGVFTGPELSGDGPYYAVFPASAGGALSGSNLSIDFPAVQTAVSDGTFGPRANVAVGLAAAWDEIYFQNVCGLLGVTLKGDQSVSSIRILSDGEECLSGTGTVTLVPNATAAGPSLPVSTIAAVIASGAEGPWRIRGKVIQISNTNYGNYYIQDDTGVMYIYGTKDEQGYPKEGSGGWDRFGIQEGDVITVEGPYLKYKETTDELVDVTVVRETSALDVQWSAGASSLALQLDSPVALSEAGKTFYLAIPAGALAKGFSLEVQDAAGGAMVKHASGNGGNLIERSSIRPMPAFTYAAVCSAAWLNIVQPGVYSGVQAGETPSGVLLANDSSTQFAWNTRSETSKFFRMQDWEMSYSLSLTLQTSTLIPGYSYPAYLTRMDDSGMNSQTGLTMNLVKKQDGLYWLSDGTTGYIMKTEEE